MVVGFCSVGVDPTLEFEKTCTDYGKWNALELFQSFMDGHIKPQDSPH